MGNFYVLVGEWKFKRQIAPQCYYENSVHLTVPLTGSLGPRSSPDWTVRTTVLKVKTVYCSQKLPIDSMHVCSVASVLSNSLRPRGLYPPGSSVHGDSPGKGTGVGCHALLQGIFPTQGLNPCLLCLLHWQEVLYHLCHLGWPCCLSKES